MKRNLIALALLAPCALIAQQKEFSIKGKIGKVNAPATAYLTYRQANSSVTDSSAVTNGVFEFKGAIDEPVQGVITLNYLGTGTKGKLVHRRPFYLEATRIKINSKDSLTTAKISGKINVDNEKLTQALKPSSDKMAAFMADYFALPPDKQKDSSVRAVLDKKYNAIDEEQKAAYVGFIKSHPNTIVSLDALKRFGGATPDIAVVAPLFESFSESVKNSTAGKEYAVLLDKLNATSIGSMAPEFTQNDPSGNMVKLSSFRGKYLLVDFWASWCGPCRVENPNVVKAYAKYHEKGFEILGVSLDNEKGKENWIKAIEKDGLKWPQVSDLKYWNNEVAQLYAIRSIPQNFLLDPTGKIIAKNLRGEALEKKLAELFQL
ncbi:AhpC/TSA family protein [Chitinophagaceae bacterium LB-8]|uniref:AhpC/TSA family protein n=1 Tax=Paraflavisolibacter caeni TaxID=2982496 RepID=A0A9X2XUY7_9BACT|nr:TlpA disulfide reductase family protein [Paraflavisolibacter caeni]MCU7548997.1 AhpC/TSA family protein [Paraflavisolibacter caeni]